MRCKLLSPHYLGSGALLLAMGGRTYCTFMAVRWVGTDLMDRRVTVRTGRGTELGLAAAVNVSSRPFMPLTSC